MLHILKYSIFTCILSVLFISIGGPQAMAQSDLSDYPDWYLNPPADDSQYLYSTANGLELSEVIANAFLSMAMKLEAKVDATQKASDTATSESEGMSSSSKVIVSQRFGAIRVTGLQESFSEEIMDGEDVLYNEEFSSLVKLHMQEGDAAYLVESTMMERIREESPQYHRSVTETESGLDLADVLDYVESQAGLDMTRETRWMDNKYEYFVLLKLSVEEARKMMK